MHHRKLVAGDASHLLLLFTLLIAATLAIAYAAPDAFAGRR